MAIDLNADVGTIIKSLMGGKGSKDGAASAQKDAKDLPKFLQDPYKGIVITSSAVLLFIIAFVFMVYFPRVEGNQAKREEITRLEGLKEEIKGIDSQIKQLNDALGESKEHYKELLAKFSNSEDLGELYQSISAIALNYNLVVLNLKEVAKAAAPAKKKKDEEVTAEEKIMQKVSGIKVDVELKGWYGNYIKFREELAENEELLAISSEVIKVGDAKEEQGKIVVKMQLSTYALDKNPYYKAIGDEEKNG